jgi:hypothetical protein
LSDLISILLRQVRRYLQHVCTENKIRHVLGLIRVLVYSSCLSRAYYDTAQINIHVNLPSGTTHQHLESIDVPNALIVLPFGP